MLPNILPNFRFIFESILEPIHLKIIIWSSNSSLHNRHLLDPPVQAFTTGIYLILQIISPPHKAFLNQCINHLPGIFRASFRSPLFKSFRSASFNRDLFQAFPRQFSEKSRSISSLPKAYFKRPTLVSSQKVDNKSFPRHQSFSHQAFPRHSDLCVLTLVPIYFQIKRLIF